LDSTMYLYKVLSIQNILNTRWRRKASKVAASGLLKIYLGSYSCNTMFVRLLAVLGH
jgi:hypothetical protein